MKLQINDMKKIQYSITFLGTIEVPNNYSDEQIKAVIDMDAQEYGCNITYANDIEWEEV